MNNITMTAESVRGILDGRKTQTRRVMKPANPRKSNAMGGYCQGNGLWVNVEPDIAGGAPNGYIKDYSVSACWLSREQYIKECAPHKVGDVLYVKERVREFSGMQYVWSGGVYTPAFDFAGWHYSADDAHLRSDEGFWGEMFFLDGDTMEDIDYGKWRSPRYMPKAAARIFLRVIGARIQRLQEISDEDAIAEGCTGYWGWDGDDPPIWFFTNPALQFWELWDSINGKRNGGQHAWEKNLWVWAYTFEWVEKPEGWA